MLFQALERENDLLPALLPNNCFCLTWKLVSAEVLQPNLMGAKVEPVPPEMDSYHFRQLIGQITFLKAILHKNALQPEK